MTCKKDSHLAGKAKCTSCRLATLQESIPLHSIGGKTHHGVVGYEEIPGFIGVLVLASKSGAPHPDLRPNQHVAVMHGPFSISSSPHPLRSLLSH